MIRETLSSNSTDAYMFFWPNLWYFYYRSTTGGSISYQSGGPSSPAYPYWVRLTRTGNTISAFASADGVNWSQVGTSVTINMASSIDVGFGAPSQSSSQGTATFDNVSISTPAAPAPVITGISATTASVGTQVQIYGANFGATQGASLVTVNGTSAMINLWSDSSIVFTVPVGATSGPVLVLEGASLNDSNGVRLTITSQPLPGPWLDSDIGNVSVAGTATFSGGTFSVSGGGYVGSTADSMHFVYQSLTGDGSITARIASLQGVAAPVMIRQTLFSNSVDAWLFFAPNTWYLYYRPTIGANMSSQTGGGGTPPPAYPYWVKLVRTGNTITGFGSADGTNWIQVGTGVTVNMASTVYIGFGVPGMSSSHGTATFDNISVTVGTTPYVSSVSPLVGGVGTTVTISGSNFGDTQVNSTVQFGGVQATVTSWSSTQIVATVPSGVTTGTGPVTVVVNSIQSNGSVIFTTVNPVITSITPAGAAPGANITLNGTGFLLNGELTQVSFNGVAASVLTYGNSSATVSVPPNATNGPVTLSVGSYPSNPVQFTVEPQPNISTVSPAQGNVGDWPITITGAGFGATQGNSTLTFNGSQPATIVSWSDTSIEAVVPGDGATGAITVTVGGLSADSPTFHVTGLVQLTDSLGDQSTYSSTMAVGGVWVNSDTRGPGCSSCSVRGDTHNVYDDNGNLLSTTDALGHTITYTYDGNNNLTSESAQLDTSTTVKSSYTYNNFEEVLTATDPFGNVTTNTYDAHGNLLSVATPAPSGGANGSVTQFAYDTKGELTQITDPLNNVTKVGYNTVGLISSITDAQQNVTSYGYDAHGNRTSVVDAMQHTTTFGYDAGDRLTTITYPDGTQMSFGYDSRGRRTSVTDQNGKITTYAYDDADRLVSVTDAANNLTQYAYDTEDNLTSITDAMGHVTSFNYDAFGRVTQTNFPSSLAETYTYDAIGNLTSKTDRKQQTIGYVYDALNRLTHKGYPDSTGVDYVYDLVGKVKQVTDPSGTYGFAYDNMGRLIGTTTQYSFLPGHSFTTSYGYDSASNLISTTNPDGSTNRYTYDTLNRLTNLTNSWAGQFGFGYDVLSRRTSLNRPNGVNTSYSYDSLSRLLSVLHQAGGATIDGASYVLDNAGNRTSMQNLMNGVSSGYSYDAIYELMGVQQGGSATENYTYDKVGNRLSSITSTVNQYDSSNELTSDASFSYQYDNNGNMISKTDANAATTGYTWDFENRLTSVVLPGTGGTVSFKYDPFGRRIQKSSASGTTNYTYDDANITAEYDGAGNVVAQYTRGAGIDESLAMSRSGTISYYNADGLGSITSLTDSAGSALAAYTRDAFGKSLSSAGTLVNPIRYTAREWDSETGLYYNRARYYETNTGRFISEDPIRFAGSSSFYVYTQNRPVNATDPTGLKIKLCSRAGFQNRITGGIGNHAYLYDTRNGHNCGRGNQSGLENINADGTFCVEVPGSEGHEDAVMHCCEETRKHAGIWFPWVNDCQNLAGDCLTKNGLQNPGAPGGRIDCRGNCPAPTKHEHFMSGW
jgi:RHS repeat-associated protein